MSEYSPSMQEVIIYLLSPGSYNDHRDLTYRRQPAELGQDIGGVVLNQGSEVFQVAYSISGRVLYPFRFTCVCGEIGSPTTIYADPVIEKFFVCFVDPFRWKEIFSQRPKKIEARAFSPGELLELLRGPDNDDKPDPPSRRGKKFPNFTNPFRKIYGAPKPA